MLLRCGACETWREVTVANAAAEAYDAALDRQAAALRALARRLDRECMAMQVEAMIIALRCGLIDAADFAG